MAERRRRRGAMLLVASLAIGLGAGPASARLEASWRVGGLREGGRLASPLLRLPGPIRPPIFSSPLLGMGAVSPVAVAPRATWMGWLPSLLLAGAWAGLQAGVDPPEDSRWTDRNSFDSAVRRGLRGESRNTRKNAEHASDGIFAASAVMLAVDWWWLRGEYGFLRSVQVDTRYLFANNVATRIAKVSAGRQRPYVQPCGRDDDYVPSCGSGRDKNAGFWSGHASNTATIAGLLCARHLGRRERDLLDAFACGGAVAGALTDGILRIVSEHHFATDVIAGWATGAIFGYLLPRTFDYRGERAGPLTLAAFAPVIGRDYYGFHAGFRF